MRILINHLTRMQHGYICVAGVNVEALESLRLPGLDASPLQRLVRRLGRSLGLQSPAASLAHVRPTSRDRLSARLLARSGGPFDLGAIVDLGATSHAGKPPELEDHQFDARHAARRAAITPDAFWQCLTHLTRPRLTDIFGPQLTPKGRSSCGVDVGQGQASLGCLTPTGQPELYLRSRPDRADQVRVRFTDGEFAVDVGVTDIRFYDLEQATANQSAVQEVAARLRRGVPALLSVGLSRPYAPDPAAPPVHWLQVNNIHLADDPLWQPAPTSPLPG